MKPNNYYYKRIAKKVDSTIDCDKFKSNVFYMRRIAIKHGGSYTNHRSSNKYLHDWAVALGYTYTDHEYNIKYLYDIAKYYDSSVQANQTENHYLIIIHDNIVPPTPLQKLHEIDVELTDGKNILSYADRTTGNEYATLTFTAKDEEDAPIPNLELSLDVTGEQTSTITTDSNGQYEITYNTQGIGDVEISLSKEVEGILVSKTYGIVDAQLFDPMTSNSGHWVIPSGLTPLYDSNGCTIGNLSGWKSMGVTQQFNSPVSMEFELVSRTLANNSAGACPLVEFKGLTHQSTNDHLIGFLDANHNNKLAIYDKDSTETQSMTVANGVYRIDFESSTNVKVYYEDTLIYSSTNWNIANPYFTIGTGANRSFTFKNVKVKPL